MHWKYHIPHVWNPPHSRTTWAEIWLLPDDASYNGESIWLTIDTLGFVPFDADPAPFRTELLEKLGDREFVITKTDMLVRAEDFDRDEFLKWVEVWIKEAGLAFSGLVEGRFDDFADTNNMAREIRRLRELHE